METVYEKACGIDVHKDLIVSCVIVKGRRQIRSFGTMTRDLLELTAWLKETGCQMTAMESTGSYWKPVYNLLEAEGIPAMVVNAQHIKNVPGRKTDVKDSEWIADLLRHGLLRASYIPARDQRELRELVRYRKSMIEERAREFNRVQKVLEGANIKLGSVVSNIEGKSATAMIDAIVSGNTDPDELSELAKGSLKEKKAELAKALQGVIGSHQRMILGAMRQHIRVLDSLIESLDAEIAGRLAAQSELLEAIETIPGVGERSAQVILAEIGWDMSVFPTAHHLASWAGVCPGNNESAGKKHSGRTRKSNKTLKTILVQCAKANARGKSTYLYAQYSRIASRRGANKATIAVAHSILIIVYHILKNGGTYRELGGGYFDEIRKEAVVRRAVKRIEALGYTVSAEPLAI